LPYFGITSLGIGHVSDQVECCIKGIQQKPLQMVCVFYDVLATIYFTKVNPSEQYLTQEAAPGYGYVTHDIGHANFNHSSTTSTTT
jgi:hypothetical protein